MLETIPHPTPTRDFNNVVLKIKAANPDILIPANYYNEYVLLARTMQQQQVRPKAAIYSVLGGAASSYKFVKEFPQAAQCVYHGLQSLVRSAQCAKPKPPEKQGRRARSVFHVRSLSHHYSAFTLLLADAIEQAQSSDRAKIIEALSSSTFADHVMPYGPTKFVNGQNQGAAPANTQVIGNDIQVILPAAFTSAQPVYPLPRA